MSVLAVGLSHRTADLRTLEQVTVPDEKLGKALHELQHAQDVSEVMLVSTCNRVEVYAVVESFHGGLSGVSSVLAWMAGVDVADLYDDVYVHYAGAAVEHIFSVTCGLDSMVIGETQILGQIRSAYAAARDAGTVGSTLHQLIQTTLRVGKRVHTETGLGAIGASVVSKALEAATGENGDLAGCAALIIGAGSMGALAGAQLRDAGIADVTVANRSADNAAHLASSFTEHGIPARVIGLDAVRGALDGVDVVVCCTGAQDVVLTPEQFPARGEVGELVICDLGLPRDVDPAVGELNGLRIVDLETVRYQAESEGSSTEIEGAAGIIREEVREYLADQRSAAVTPTVTALRKQAGEVVDAELHRLDRRLPELDDQVREEVNRTVRRVVDKLLHAPTVRVKQLASEEDTTDYAGALRELFGLDPSAPATLANPALRQGKHDRIDAGGADGADGAGGR